ncbi:MAG TPA: transcriptional regulator NrdR [Acidobacteriota bacterium]|jgi:transcriptional repressor NrdR
MKCPYCGYTKDRVVDSRESKRGEVIRRRRQCGSCGKRFTSYERIEEIPYMVVKKDQSRELFDRDKIRRGILKACEKRPVPITAIEEIIEEIENRLQNSAERELPTEEIGGFVMESLRKLDEVAYVRFASVYRSFRDLNEFMAELSQIIQSRGEHKKESA